MISRSVVKLGVRSEELGVDPSVFDESKTSPLKGATRTPSVSKADSSLREGAKLTILLVWDKLLPPSVREVAKR